jgi:hypothetical protein
MGNPAEETIRHPNHYKFMGAANNVKLEKRQKVRTISLAMARALGDPMTVLRFAAIHRIAVGMR